jgi:hypothetical protein
VTGAFVFSKTLVCSCELLLSSIELDEQALSNKKTIPKIKKMGLIQLVLVG